MARNTVKTRKPAAIVNTETANNAVEIATNKAVAPQFNIKELTLEAADKAIAQIVKSGDSLRKLAHETLCGILLHYEAHGDYTRLRRPLKKTSTGRMVIDDKAPIRLYEALETSVGRSMARAFVEYVVDNTSLRWNDETKTFYHNKRDRRIPEGKRGYVNLAAFDIPFWKYEREPEMPKPLDSEAVMRIIKNAVQRLVTLEIEKLSGREIGAGKEKRNIKLKHEVNDELVIDMLTFAEKHGLQEEVTEFRRTLQEAGLNMH